MCVFSQSVLPYEHGFTSQINDSRLNKSKKRIDKIRVQWHMKIKLVVAVVICIPLRTANASSRNAALLNSEK